MKEFSIGDYRIELNKKGADRYEKVSFPIRYGRYSEVRSETFVFQFSLNGEIRFIMNAHSDLIEPTEWLKRTIANDWVFYSSGGYNGAIQTIGEYYIPCFTYQTNAITGGNPFKNGILETALSELRHLTETLKKEKAKIKNSELQSFVRNVLENSPAALERKKKILHSVIGGPVTVLPPDSRHVDYDLIPVSISEGCLYKCRFCSVKTGRHFRKRSLEEINEQISLLDNLLSPDITGYNSVFLGDQDALFCGADHIRYAAEAVYTGFHFTESVIRSPSLFLFGSVDSLLKLGDKALESLNRLPFRTWINIGLESFDAETISILGKPVSQEKIHRAFDRILSVNASFENLTLTANFVIGDRLPQSHDESFIRKTSGRNLKAGRTTLYLSPFEEIKDRRKMLNRFRELKQITRIPTYLYLIQRL